jgi:flagellar FliL protein
MAWVSGEMSGQAGENGQGHVAKGGSLKMIVMIVLPVVLLAGGGAAAWLLGLVPGGEPAEAAPAAAEPAPQDIVFVELPNLLINLNVAGKRMRFLKVATALEIDGKEQAELVRQLTPRIVDNMNVYFRAIRPEELAGPEGVYRVKEDLLVRINDTVQPAVVRDVLVKEMLIQ